MLSLIAGHRLLLGVGNDQLVNPAGLGARLEDWAVLPTPMAAFVVVS
jgi:hypothetical protein